MRRATLRNPNDHAELARLAAESVGAPRPNTASSSLSLREAPNEEQIKKASAEQLRQMIADY